MGAHHAEHTLHTTRSPGIGPGMRGSSTLSSFVMRKDYAVLARWRMRKGRRFVNRETFRREHGSALPKPEVSIKCLVIFE